MGGGGINWATVASFPSAGPWHAARRLLSRQRIESRLGPDLSDSEEMALQVPATEVEWAREIIARGFPELPEIARPQRGFEVVLPTAPHQLNAKRVLPVIEIPEGPAPPTASQGLGYRVTITILWGVLVLIALSMVWVWFL
jgi:hypothetical protein